MSKTLKIILLVVVVLCLLIGGMYAIERPIQIANDSLVFELGADINFTVKDFVRKDTKGIKMEYDEEAISEVGSHDVILQRSGIFSILKRKTVHLVVQDTLPPEVWKFKSNMVLEVTGEPLDLAQYIVAVDQSGTPNVSVYSDKTIDTTKEGNYDITITCTDMYGNKTQKEAKLSLLKTENIKHGTEVVKKATEADRQQAYLEIYGKTKDRKDDKYAEYGTKVGYYSVDEFGNKVELTTTNENMTEDEEALYVASLMGQMGHMNSNEYNEWLASASAQVDNELANMCEVPDWFWVYETEEEALKYIEDNKENIDYYNIVENKTAKCNKTYYTVDTIKVEPGAEELYKGVVDYGYKKLDK